MTAALVFALVATVAVAAQGPRGGGAGRGRGGPDGPLGDIPLASLNLTQAQQDQIRAIRERSRQEMQLLQERTRNDVLAVLTAQQLAEVTRLQTERQQRREQRRSTQQPQ